MLGQPVGIEPLDGLHDPTMQRAPPLLEQTAIGHVVGQGMLEGVLEVRKDAGLVEELRGLQAADGGVQLILGVLGNRLEQRKRHVLPDHRRRLENGLVPRRQPVDTGGQHGLHCGRDLDRWQRLRQPVGTALAQQGPGLDKRPHALLQEERVALRARDQQAL